MKSPLLVLAIISGLMTVSCGGGGSTAVTATPSTTTSTVATRTIGTSTYTWQFSCGGGQCLQGRFIGGDIWIAPKVPGEQVKMLGVATNGVGGGVESNPSSATRQGFLSCYVSSYDPVLDLSTRLPLSVEPNTSVVKATSRTSNCQPASSTCCIDTYDVVTVLPVPPANSETTAFRPGMAGTDKRIFRTSDFDFTQLPADQRVNNSGVAADFSGTTGRWFTPFVDHYMWKLGDGGRSFAPKGIPDYGADQGAVYLSDLIRAMGTEPLATKQMAINAMLQRGIDLYASYKSGIQWPSGAGQQAGRKPAVAFFGAMVTDNAIKAEIRALSDNDGNVFHEDGQIRVKATGGNVPVWGDPCEERIYWSNVFYAQMFAGGTGVQIGSGDNTRTCGDPYGWIDGPGGMPGTFYMACCSTGEFIGYQLAQSLMPAYCSAANDPHLSVYTRRVLTSGVHTQPDVCAPPDPREPAACAPFAAGAPGCLFYKSTWGPDPANPGDCIRNGPGQNGRFPSRHGFMMPDIFREPFISKKMRDQNGLAILNSCN